MYRCEKCNTVTPAGASANFVVTKIRKRSYTIRRRVRGARRGQDSWQNAPGGDGWECVQEQLLCDECAKAAEDDPTVPEVVEVVENVSTSIDLEGAQPAEAEATS